MNLNLTSIFTFFFIRTASLSYYDVSLRFVRTLEFTTRALCTCFNVGQLREGLAYSESSGVLRFHECSKHIIFTIANFVVTLRLYRIPPLVAEVHIV